MLLCYDPILHKHLRYKFAYVSYFKIIWLSIWCDLLKAQNLRVCVCKSVLRVSKIALVRAEKQENFRVELRNFRVLMKSIYVKISSSNIFFVKSFMKNVNFILHPWKLRYWKCVAAYFWKAKSEEILLAAST